jgi:EAL domain-containing protein (putative c-di-GMP-specific phosphodiesterase class I)
MHRPARVGDAIHRQDNGLQIGRYGRFTLYSAYQPLYRYTRHQSLKLVGLEGLIRPYVDDVSITPSMLYQQTDIGDCLFIECMCHALHIRNFQSATPGECDLFININPAIYTSMEMLEREFTFLLSQLWGNGISARQMVFEVVETEPCCEKILTWLRSFAQENQVRVAIDDFGKGYSDLQRYELLKPDLVKIDGQVFARGMRPSKESHMLQSIIKRVHDDGGQVVIEGIETPTMLAMALELEADLLQGFYLDTPHIPPHDFTGHRFPVQSNALH